MVRGQTVFMGLRVGNCSNGSVEENVGLLASRSQLWNARVTIRTDFPQKVAQLSIKPDSENAVKHVVTGQTSQEPRENYGLQHSFCQSTQ